MLSDTEKQILRTLKQIGGGTMDRIASELGGEPDMERLIRDEMIESMASGRSMFYFITTKGERYLDV